MCTVSFVKTPKQVILTSNRDEHVSRPVSIEPKVYELNGQKVIFPKDPKAGGSWFAVQASGTVAILLNGAAEKHIVQGNYTRSRGLVLLDVIGTASPLLAWEVLELSGVEPFTIVLYHANRLYQLRWDASKKETTELSTAQAHIWSSSTLYPAEVRAERASWFYRFLQEQPLVGPDVIRHFHLNTNPEDKQNGLIINRHEQMKTFSVTQCVLTDGVPSVFHVDLLQGKQFPISF